MWMCLREAAAVNLTWNSFEVARGKLYLLFDYVSFDFIFINIITAPTLLTTRVKILAQWIKSTTSDQLRFEEQRTCLNWGHFRRVSLFLSIISLYKGGSSLRNSVNDRKLVPVTSFRTHVAGTWHYTYFEPLQSVAKDPHFSFQE